MLLGHIASGAHVAQPCVRQGVGTFALPRLLAAMTMKRAGF